MPKKAFLEITNVCNLACSFCPGHDREARFMTLTEFTILSEKLKNEYLYLYFHLMGEPLLHPDLIPMIRIAKEKGFRPMITTNGTLLYKAGKELAASGVYKVSISLHSFAANNKEGISFAEYIADCIQFAKTAAENGLIVALRLWNLHSAEEMTNDPVLDVLHTSFPGEWLKNRSGCRLCDHVFLEWGDKFDWPYLKDLNSSDQKTGDRIRFCYGLRDQIGVLCDGTVVPCCLDRNGDLALGNLFLSNINEILSSPRAEKIYQGFTAGKAVENLCRNCGYAHRINIKHQV